MNEASTQDRYTATEQSHGKRYMLEISTGIVGFLVLFLGLPLAMPANPDTAISLLVAVLPILPLFWVVIAIARHVGRVDEMQRALMLRSFAWGFGASILASLALLLLSRAGISVEYSAIAVFIAGMTGWGAALAVLSIKASH